MNFLGLLMVFLGEDFREKRAANKALNRIGHKSGLPVSSVFGRAARARTNRSSRSPSDLASKLASPIPNGELRGAPRPICPTAR